MKKHIKKIIHKTKRLRDKVADMNKPTRKRTTTKAELPKPEKVERVVVELSMASVAKATLLIIFLYLLVQFFASIEQILIIFFVSVFLAAALDPTVDKLQEKKIPRAIGVLLIYFAVFIFLFIFFSQLIPLIATQVSELANKVAEFITNITSNGESDLPFAKHWKPFLDDFLVNVDQDTIIANLQAGLEYIAGQLSNVAGNTWTALTVIFNGLVNALIVLVLTFFLVIEEENSESFLRSLFPSKYSHYIVTKTNEVKDKVGDWLRGQITLAITMGVITGIGFFVLGVEYAATLGMIAAIAEFLPMIGPTVTFLAGALIASNQSLWLVLGVAIWCAFMQILEGNVLIPLIMRKAVGLSPVIIILAMLVGFQFLGILGIVIALPTATVISIFIGDYAKKKK